MTMQLRYSVLLLLLPIFPKFCYAPICYAPKRVARDEMIKILDQYPQCAICHESFKTVSTCSKGHKIHTSCYKDGLDTIDKCSLCREPNNIILRNAFNHTTAGEQGLYGSVLVLHNILLLYLAKAIDFSHIKSSFGVINGLVMAAELGFFLSITLRSSKSAQLLCKKLGGTKANEQRYVRAWLIGGIGMLLTHTFGIARIAASPKYSISDSLKSIAACALISPIAAVGLSSWCADRRF